MESRVLYFSVGALLESTMVGRDWYYKASFDKANRTSIDGSRGPGLKAGIALFREFKQQFPEIRLTTDIHECHQAEALVPFIDCIQIPAFLCRQTDLLVECGRIFNKVNIKKGQWISPDNILAAAEKVKSANEHAEVWLTERGTQFGYERLIVDFRTVDDFKQYFHKVVLDCTHSTQFTRPNGRTSGDRKLAGRYLMSASLFGYTGVFAEVHPSPSESLSDGDSQILLDDLASLLGRHDAISGAAVESCMNTEGVA